MPNRKRLIAEFLELVKIDSPGRQERQIADLLKERLVQFGMEVYEDQAGKAIGGNCGNVFGYLRGNLPEAPVLLLSAHMDTVEPSQNIEPLQTEGIISSAGATILGADDKSGIVPILEALRVIKEQNIPHGDIQVVFSIAEEGGLNGSKNLDSTKLKANLGFVLDSSGAPGRIILEAPGQDRINVSIKGRASHAGIVPEEGINAIVAASKAIANVPCGRLDEETTANVGTIRGGLATNIVAENVEIACESRSRDLNKLEKLTEEICKIFQNSAEEMGASAEIKVQRLYSPFKLSQESQIAVLAANAAKAAGLTPEFIATGGGSDANNYNSYGVPSLVLSTGMGKIHTTDEYILEEDLVRTTQFVIEIIKAVSSQTKDFAMIK
ncbi:peptidase T-like protein [Desulfosporosinus acidiphilus SJ4]|uniref:Peptidase T-like protein n=1 Tax=Desulfosporosinus acidiphilus (strain DSM 22704 / JCM 16185 / SJ4) TaxID=646529 RepID=I4D6C2_DESAJ|nr:M20/M25/M40 family metallo-hydrolase [Desulfosporosinus acidiphilus]AFM41346.1 peptidase T-like protein [Desulfosporosinus acidiphilus SJ4]